MDNKTIGLEDTFIARNTTDPALRSMLSNRETLTRQRPPEVKINPYLYPNTPSFGPRGVECFEVGFL